MKKIAKRKASTSSGNGKVDADDVRDQLGVIMEDVRSLGRQLGHLTTNRLHSIGDRARAVGEGFGDRVRGNPMRSLLIAAGIGALVGLCWRRH